MKAASAYGHSRVGGMACTIARCPMLYGAGDSKLERLVALWCRVGTLPVPAEPVHRSMVHYDLAARYLHERTKSGPVRPGVTIEHFADPLPFEYGIVARVLSRSTGQIKRTVTLPITLFGLFEAVLPRVPRRHQSHRFDAVI